MTKPTITIHNCETQEVEVRQMNEGEYDQWQADQAKRAAEIIAEANKELARQELLNRLGITDDEAKLLLS
jgi:hypothetical protein